MAASNQPTNTAAWLDEAGASFSIREAPMPEPGPDEVIIKTAALAVNPVDAARQALGFLIQSYPWIFGCDGAGVITAVGSDIRENDLKVGDRVIALSDEWSVHKPSHGMYQRYVAVSTKYTCKIPDAVSFEDGVVLPLGILTATSMMFEKDNLELSWPVDEEKGVTAPMGKGKPGTEKEVVVIWGGSSSVGACAVQLAKAAGYKVVGTARKVNFGLLEECGADATFDHTDEDVVDKLCKWVEERGLKLAGVAAAISSDDALSKCGLIAQRLDGMKWVSTSRAKGISPVPEMPEGVQASNALGIEEPELQEHIFKKWMSAALESRQLKCKPNANIVGTGLGSLDEACALMRKGVSGQKIVVKLE